MKIKEDIATSGDDGTDDLSHSDPLDAVDRLVNQFRIPLQKAGANTDKICKSVVNSKQCLSMQFNLFHCLQWITNQHGGDCSIVQILHLARLLFCLPASKGKLERAFSQVKAYQVWQKECS